MRYEATKLEKIEKPELELFSVPMFGLHFEGSKYGKSELTLFVEKGRKILKIESDRNFAEHAVFGKTSSNHIWNIKTILRADFEKNPNTSDFLLEELFGYITFSIPELFWDINVYHPG